MLCVILLFCDESILRAMESFIVYVLTEGCILVLCVILLFCDESILRAMESFIVYVLTDVVS